MTSPSRRLPAVVATAVVPALLLTGALTSSATSSASASADPTTRVGASADAGVTARASSTSAAAHPVKKTVRKTAKPARTKAPGVAAGSASPPSRPAATPKPTPTPTPTPVVTQVPRELVWKDDFTGSAGSRVDSRWWTEQAGGEGWGNEELQRYQDGGRNAALDGAGHLVITARQENAGTCWYGPCRYTSARLTTSTKVSASSGRVEARMKLPAGTGLWPAFWMLGENMRTVGHPQCGEIDVAELVGDQPGEVWSGVHGPGYVNAGLARAFRLPAGRTFSDDFHTFAVDWTPTGLEFSVDGQVYNRVNKSDIGAGNEWVFDKPMHILLNLAVGGSWPGDPAPTTRFPARMVVDHVAIYR